VTHLRKTMLEELERRNYSENTPPFYIRIVEDFSRPFNRPPDRLGPRHIREYQAELSQKRRLSPGTVAHHLVALRPGIVGFFAIDVGSFLAPLISDVNLALEGR
jgi:integrase/recombinase XerD